MIHIGNESRVEWIVMMEDLQINHFIQIHSILSITVDTDSWNASSPSSMECRFGRSMHLSNHQYNISIPRITNDPYQKLRE